MTIEGSMNERLALQGDSATSNASEKMLQQVNNASQDIELAAGRAGARSELIRSTAHPTEKTVALTIDDGPNPKYTPEVLKLLDENNIKATFCLVGQEVKAHPELVKEIVADGDMLCDHSMTHDEHLPKKSDAVIKQEILGDKELIQSIVPGAEIPFYRAPGGNFAGHVSALAASWGMKSLSWSVDTRDWERPGVDKILANVDRELRPGGVILMHDAGGDRSQSIAALTILIPKLEKEGYKFDFPASS